MSESRQNIKVKLRHINVSAMPDNPERTPNDMPQLTPTIRKLEPPSAGDFDEQLWPVNFALILVGACIAGWILATADFYADVWWHSGWFLLFALVASTGSLCVLAAYVGGAAADGCNWPHSLVSVRMSFLSWLCIWDICGRKN